MGWVVLGIVGQVGVSDRGGIGTKYRDVERWKESGAANHMWNMEDVCQSGEKSVVELLLIKDAR